MPTLYLLGDCDICGNQVYSFCKSKDPRVVHDDCLFREANKTEEVSKAPEEAKEEEKQETWRDRPSML